MKSWVCIVMLTFLLPAGATQLTDMLFVAVAKGVEKSPAALAGRQVSNGPSTPECPEVVFGKTL